MQESDNLELHLMPETSTLFVMFLTVRNQAQDGYKKYIKHSFLNFLSV